MCVCAYSSEDVVREGIDTTHVNYSLDKSQGLSSVTGCPGSLRGFTGQDNIQIIVTGEFMT